MGLIFVTQGHLCQQVVTLSTGAQFRGVFPNPEKGDFVPSPKLTRKKVTFGLIWISHNRIKVAFGSP
jgi:hypothetical protein